MAEMNNQRSQRPGRPQHEDIDPHSLAAIRGIMNAGSEMGPQSGPDRAARHDEGHQHQRHQPHDHAETAVHSAPKAAARMDLKAQVASRLSGYRPKPKHIGLIAFALLVVMRPWLVLGLFILCLIVMIGVFLILGYDGFWARVMSAARWYAKRRPERAMALHRKLDGMAMKWDAVLDRFPEGTVDGLYLPDFGGLAVAAKRQEEALDRRYSNIAEREA